MAGASTSIQETIGVEVTPTVNLPANSYSVEVAPPEVNLSVAPPQVVVAPPSVSVAPPSVSVSVPQEGGKQEKQLLAILLVGIGAYALIKGI